MSTQRKELLIKRFKKLLRSDEDLRVEYMCERSASGLYYTTGTAMKIINAHYQEVITDKMKDFVNNLDCKRKEEVKMFGEEFSYCDRESILIIRYIRRNG